MSNYSISIKCLADDGIDEIKVGDIFGAEVLIAGHGRRNNGFRLIKSGWYDHGIPPGCSASWGADNKTQRHYGSVKITKITKSRAFFTQC